MRYAVAGILLTDAVILMWAWRTLDTTSFLFMVFALACVTFFGSLPIAAGAWTRRRDTAKNSGAMSRQPQKSTRIVAKLEATGAPRTPPPLS